ncbi:MAG: hypothetical protein ABEJ73_06215 [Haloplanus sp.]
METRPTVALVILLVGVGALPLGAPVAAQSTATPTPDAGSSPTIAVDVDGTPLDSGDVYHTATDPWVRVTVSADDPVSLIEVRIDGETRHVFEPGRKSVARNVVLDMERGRHRVRIVAKAGGVATHDATIIRDDTAPVINYSSPFASDSMPEGPEHPPATKLTVNRANVTINGTLTDLSTVEYVRIDNDYQYRLVGEDDADHRNRRQHFIDGPGESFNQSLYLALGANDITIRAEDAVGHLRTHEFTISVKDDTPPSVNVTDIEWVSSTRLHVEGTASDRVQVQSVWLASENGTADETISLDDGDRHPLVFPQPTAPDRDRRNVTLDTTVYHPPGRDYVVLGANDTAGNQQTWNYSLATFLAPNITVSDRRTGYVGDRTVAVGGSVTGGQVANVSVEAVDPSTGRIVDIRPVELGSNGSFGARLDGVTGTTRVRVRVRDASGAEHLVNTTVSAPAPNPPTESDAGDDGAAEESDTGAAGGDDAPSGVHIPFVGVVIPVPTVGVPAPLDAAVSVPIPFLGSLDVPLAGVGVAVLLALVAVRWR